MHDRKKQHICTIYNTSPARCRERSECWGRVVDSSVCRGCAIPLFRRLQRVVIALLWLASDRAAIVCVPISRRSLALSALVARRSSFSSHLCAPVAQTLGTVGRCLCAAYSYSDFVQNTHADGVYGYLTFAVAVVPFALSPSLLWQKKFSLSARELAVGRRSITCLIHVLSLLSCDRVLPPMQRPARRELSLEFHQ